MVFFHSRTHSPPIRSCWVAGRFLLSLSCVCITASTSKWILFCPFKIKRQFQPWGLSLLCCCWHSSSWSNDASLALRNTFTQLDIIKRIAVLEPMLVTNLFNEFEYIDFRWYIWKIQWNLLQTKFCNFENVNRVVLSARCKVISLTALFFMHTFCKILYEKLDTQNKNENITPIFHLK